jgi:hypothetical protein
MGTYGPTNQRTDAVSYRGATLRLISLSSEEKEEEKEELEEKLRKKKKTN